MVNGPPTTLGNVVNGPFTTLELVSSQRTAPRNTRDHSEPRGGYIDISDYRTISASLVNVVGARGPENREGRTRAEGNARSRRTCEARLDLATHPAISMIAKTFGMYAMINLRKIWSLVAGLSESAKVPASHTRHAHTCQCQFFSCGFDGALSTCKKIHIHLRIGVTQAGEHDTKHLRG